MNEKLLQLIRVLTEQTDAGRVKWSQVFEDVFRTSVANSLIRISHGDKEVEVDDQDWKSVPMVNLVVTNPDGAIVEDEDILEGDRGYAPSERLFKAARRSATHGDELLDELLNSLKQTTRP